MNTDNVIRDIKESRFGRRLDPCWSKYHQWSEASFPIELPACTVTHSEKAISFDDRAIIKCLLHDGIAMVVRVDLEDGRILKEILPVHAEASNPEKEGLVFTVELDREALSGKIGIGFEWVFNIPVRPPGHYQPAKPLGVVMLDGSELFGKEFLVTIRKNS